MGLVGRMFVVPFFLDWCGLVHDRNETKGTFVYGPGGRESAGPSALKAGGGGWRPRPAAWARESAGPSALKTGNRPGLQP